MHSGIAHISSPQLPWLIHVDGSCNIQVGVRRKTFQEWLVEPGCWRLVTQYQFEADVFVLPITTMLLTLFFTLPWEELNCGIQEKANKSLDLIKGRSRLVSVQFIGGGCLSVQRKIKQAAEQSFWCHPQKVGCKEGDIRDLWRITSFHIGNPIKDKWTKDSSLGHRKKR